MKLIGLILALVTVFTVSSFGQVENLDEDYCIAVPSASFPGGQDSLINFIKGNLKFPHVDGPISGKVFVQFIVNTDGSITDLKVLKGLCEQCDKNALEALSKMPKWTPAKKDGKPVKSRVIIPVNFKL